MESIVNAQKIPNRKKEMERQMKRDIIFDAIVWSMPLCQRGKEGRVLRAARVAWTTVEISEWVYSR